MMRARLFALLLLSLLASMPAFARAQVDLNHADARTLAEGLHGVGLVKAEAIVAYRSAHGPFRRVEDLDRVHGIGSRTIEANRSRIVISGIDRPANGNAPAPR